MARRWTRRRYPSRQRDFETGVVTQILGHEFSISVPCACQAGIYPGFRLDFAPGTIDVYVTQSLPSRGIWQIYAREYGYTYLAERYEPMRAILLEKPGKFEEINIPEPPQPGPGEVLVRVHRVGICGTDISGYLGKMPFYSYPRIPGHELGVEVVEVGGEDGCYQGDGRGELRP